MDLKEILRTISSGDLNNVILALKHWHFELLDT